MSDSTNPSKATLSPLGALSSYMNSEDSVLGTAGGVNVAVSEMDLVTAGGINVATAGGINVATAGGINVATADLQGLS